MNNLDNPAFIKPTVKNSTLNVPSSKNSILYSKPYIIWIRADGNSHVATGHLMRCLSICHALKKLGASVFFITADAESADLLAHFARAYAPYGPDGTEILHSSYDDLSAELPAIRSLYESGRSPAPSFILVDSYYADASYLSALQALAPTGYIDDLLTFDPPVSLVINYDLTPIAGLYTAPHLLQGAAYAPLRPQFSHCQPANRAKVARLLLSTGGSDPYGMAPTLIKTMSVHPLLRSLQWDVILGSLSPYRDELMKLAKTLPQLTLRENVTDMASLMCACDLAITAAGTTLYELCAAGVPSIVYTMADNQLPSARAFAKAGLVLYAGDVRTGSSHICQMILNNVKDMAADDKRRLSLSEKIRQTIDGQGAGRIAEAILKIAHCIK